MTSRQVLTTLIGLSSYTLPVLCRYTYGVTGEMSSSMLEKSKQKMRWKYFNQLFKDPKEREIENVRNLVYCDE